MIQFVFILFMILSVVVHNALNKEKVSKNSYKINFEFFTLGAAMAITLGLVMGSLSLSTFDFDETSKISIETLFMIENILGFIFAVMVIELLYFRSWLKC